MPGIFFYIAIFLAAFLSFSIQPLAGKSILPLIGGAPQGWLITLTFFQTTLVAGYGLVYLSRRLDTRIAVSCIAALLAASAYFFRPVIDTQALDNGFRLFVFLWQWMGLPLICLGTMAPLIQRLFFSAGHDNPYRLYAVSNAGSLLGLLSYPFLIEPFTGLHDQLSVWRWSVAALAICAALCVPAGKAELREGKIAAPSARTIAVWIMLAMLPSSLLSGSTLLISSDIGSFPLLWVIPLAVYLLTYILAFKNWRAEQVPRWTTYFVAISVAVLAMPVLLARTPSLLIPDTLFIAIIIGIFGLAAFLCHTRLYGLRPDSRHLPLFYFALAVGGAIGGCFNAFLAPILVPTGYEFYMVLALVIAVVSPNTVLPKNARRMAIICAIATVPMMIFGLIIMRDFIILGMLWFSLCMFVLMISVMHTRAFVIVSLICLTFHSLPIAQSSNELLKRNFFGILHVVDNNQHTARYFKHGVTLHGIQPYDASLRTTPVSYYAISGPLGDVMALMPAGRVAAVGLGTGQIACYTTPGRVIDFYEIDPDVVSIARTWFNYLNDCDKGQMIVGDARLMLAKSDIQYKLIILDTFSSDAIPAHLLTREALEIYRDRLAPGGSLMFHISNKFLSLSPVLAANAKDVGFIALDKFYNVDDAGAKLFANSSEWLIMTSDAALIESLKTRGWSLTVPASRGWSDDFAPLVWALRGIAPMTRISAPETAPLP